MLCKRIFAVAMAALLTFSLVACGGAPSATEEDTEATTLELQETTDETTRFAIEDTMETTEQAMEEVAANLPEVYEGALEDYLLPLEMFSRQREHAPEFVMIHFISAVMLSQDDPYNMETIRSIFTDYEVSVHYIVDRDGTIYCYIPENLVAWHAGGGSWANDPKYTDRLNDYAIGIEVLAIGSQQDMEIYMSGQTYHSLSPELIGFTDAQYDALRTLVHDICVRNNIPMDRQHVIGHEDYSPDKTDPGELFDWERIFTPANP